ncbi:sigma-70 family RNA polymerase sigma factor [Pseudonocardia asaccharolytica]|uniref:RNA polymerase sigma factor SigZ n=1 Tax=Pseudonocardia asaccharolytica DSM 44247 = NBRC 16224 TaxID=1123024 RepID=A0A511D849_9PSEU|nr:sigma-70 family RNA polymerase sigma factor [Pseudonocardia asaccharolytica]GEL20985.1 RNA polymerase sigma factor SigZ [Pseudonocardia asaccharolytica DSM 44247 = NBRC 16224]
MDTDTTTVGPSAEANQLTEQMWREVMAQLRAFVRRRIADPDRADDLVGEILLRVHQRLDSVDDRARLANWVFRVARNAVIDEYRRAGRDRERLVPTPVDSPAEGPVPGNEDSTGAVEELAKCLRPLLGGLPPDQRRAVELIDLDGWPQSRAARSEGVSLSGMKSRVQRGRRRLADLLGQCCELTLDARGLPMDYTAQQRCDCAGDMR